MREGFEGTADDFLIFFRHLRLYKIPDTDLEYRVSLLRRLVARKRLKYHRDGQRLLGGKNVLKIESEGGNDGL